MPSRARGWFAPLLSVSALLAGVAAHAHEHDNTAPKSNDSRVEIYGRLDLGVASFRGIEPGTTTMLQSGLSAGSGIGFKGTEDLGGGWKALFRLEHGFRADRGDVNQAEPVSGRRVPDYATAGIPEAVAPLMREALGDFLIARTRQNFWARQTLVGLVTPWGAVLAGRLYTPVFELFDRYNAMESGQVAEPFTLLAVPEALEIRHSGAIQYRMELDGWSAAVSWSGASTSGLTPTGRLVGLQLGYETPRYSVAIGHQDRRNAQGGRELSNTLLGGWVQFDDIKVMGAWLRARNPDPDLGLALVAGTAGLSDDAVTQQLITDAAQVVAQRLGVDSHMGMLGAQVQLAPAWRLIGNVAHLDDRKLEHGQATLVGAALEYRLSPRTSLWTAASHIRNAADQQVAPVTSGDLIGFALQPGQSTSALQLNISHRF